MDELERKYNCPRCAGTGSLESSDSTDDSWWYCSTCEGTCKLADRRRPDTQLRRAIDVLRAIANDTTHDGRWASGRAENALVTMGVDPRIPGVQ
jgi:transcription elongation factor Elf1